MSQFQPVHEAHAIDQLVIAVQFNPAISEEGFAAVTKAAEPFKDGLPRVVELSGFPLIGGIPMPAPIVQFANPFLQGVGARAFSKFREDGSVDTEVRVERTGISYKTSAYITWRQLLETARLYFELTLPLYAERTAFSSISLSYLDKFYWDGDATDARAVELLRTGSKYVAPHVYELVDLWHSHTGAFLRSDDATKRLLNINVDCNDENRSGTVRRVVSILTVLTDMFNQSGYSPMSWNVPEAEVFFRERLDQLHDQSKRILGQVISDAMCRRIALAISG